MREQKNKSTNKKNYEIILTPVSPPTPWYESTTANLSPNVNQFTSPPTPAIWETWSGSALNETEENDSYERKVEEEETNFISNSYSLLEQAKKIRELPP